MQLSAVVICHNEEAHIAACLKSLRNVSDDLIVIDSGSTDNTVQIAEDLGAKVYSMDWIGYGANKNYGIEQAQHDWIISLDSDEVLSQELIDTIKNLKLTNNKVYSLDRMTFYENQWIKHSGWYPDRVKRIFRKEIKWDLKEVHETLLVPTSSEIVDLNGKLEHYSYSSKDDHLQRIDRYARLAAQELIKNNEGVSMLKRILGPAFRWVKAYIIKGGFLDGRAGLQIAKLDAHMIRKRHQYYDYFNAQQNQV